jgi:hypothetical protein
VNGLGDRARTLTMVMEWQAEEEPAPPTDAGVGTIAGRPHDPAEASIDDLAVIVRTRVALVARPIAVPDPPEEMIGEPSF